MICGMIRCAIDHESISRANWYCPRLEEVIGVVYSRKEMASTPMNELQELEMKLKQIALHSVTLKETLSKYFNIFKSFISMCFRHGSDAFH